MEILHVDIREEKWIIDALRMEMPKYGFEVDVRQQDVSDYCVSNTLGIEHKAPGDFVGSLMDGRLFAQAEELKENFSNYLILVDGDMDSLMQTRSAIKPEAIEAAVSSLFTKRGVPVFFCGKNRLIQTIRNLAIKSSSGIASVYTPVRRGATTKEYQVSFMSSLPGLGKKRAMELLEFYGSPHEAFQNISVWGEHVNGIGTKTIEKVKNVLNEQKTAN